MEMTASPDACGYFFCIRGFWLPQVYPFPALEWALFSARRHFESLQCRHAGAKRKAFGVRRSALWLSAIGYRLSAIGLFAKRAIGLFAKRAIGYSRSALLAIRGACFGQKIGHILFINCGSSKGLMPGCFVARRDENKLPVGYRLFSARDKSEFGRIDLIIGKVDR
jgi:hypothetical protein